MSFGKYRLRKRRLDKCLKSRVSEDPQTDNMANGLKHCWNLNGITFTIFTKYFEGGCLGKSHF